MNSRARRLLLAGVVCVLAVSVAAATLENPVERPSGGGGTGPSQVPETGQSGAPAEPVTAPPCLAWLATPWIAVGLLAVLAAGGLAVARRFSQFEGAAFVVGLGVPLFGLYVFLTACATGGPAAVADRISRLLGLISGGGSAGSDPVVPALLLGVFLLVGAVLAATAIVVSLSDRGAEPDAEDATDPEEDASAAAGAAGAAAERIDEGGDLENEIYRAWQEMATHLDVRRPEASTPGEFATAAIEAGLAPDAVRELTELFETVRYGEFDATPEREQRAQAALERIEAGERTSGSGPTEGSR